MTSDRQKFSDQSKPSSAAGSSEKARSNVDQLSSMMAYDAAHVALSESDISTKHALYARRYASEAAARTMAGEDAVDLDSFIRENDVAGFPGDNYPIYDIASRTEVASVKTHWNVEGKLNASAMSAYKRDFYKMMGWGRSSGALMADGEKILAVHGTGACVPETLEQATATEAAEYLRDNAVLRIPSDHIQPLRDELEKDMLAFPENYQLPDNPSQKQVGRILKRVQSIGLTSGELRKLIDERMYGNDK